MESKEKCKICQEEFTQDRFNKHLRKHHIRVADYYLRYYPKTDLLTGEKREFKDKIGYFLHDFDSRANLIYFLTHDQPVIYETYAISLLKRHTRILRLSWAPSQVELRSSLLPSRNYFAKKFGSYNSVCDSIGLRSRFEESPDLSIPSIPHDFEVWRDTREQTPLEFSVPTKDVKLDFGDYTASGNNYAGVYIERKSVSDFVNTISQNYERFSAEIDRAKNLDGYLVVVVEASLKHASNFKIPQSRCTPIFIFHRVKELLQKYDNLQFVFAEDRKQAAQLATDILLLGKRAKTIDLQFHLERGELCGKPTPVAK